MEEQNTDQRIIFSSKKKLIWTGVIVALINPVFAGLIMGTIFLSEPELKKAGYFISALAILWGALQFILIKQSMVPLGS